MAVAGVVSVPIALSIAAIAILASRLDDDTPLLLPGLAMHAFVFGWWVIAAMILLGILLHVGRPWGRWQIVWTVVAVVAFLVCAIPLSITGMFPWPFAQPW